MRSSRKDHIVSSTSEGIHCFPGSIYYFVDILDFSGMKHRNLTSCACQSAVFNQIKWLQTNKLNLKSQKDDFVRRQIDLSMLVKTHTKWEWGKKESGTSRFTQKQWRLSLPTIFSSHCVRKDCFFPCEKTHLLKLCKSVLKTIFKNVK